MDILPENGRTLGLDDSGRALDGLAEDLQELLQELREETEEKLRPELENERKAEHGHALVPPDEGPLNMLQAECDLLLAKIQAADKLAGRLRAPRAIDEDVEGQLAALGLG